MLGYFKTSSKNELLEVSKAALQVFCKKNAIALVANAAFCITTIAGGVQVFPICRGLTADNLEEFGKELTVAFFADMRKKGAITQAELENLNKLMDEVDFGGVLDSNCSLLFKSLQKLSDNEDLKLALGYFEQQCKTSVLIIEKFKPL